MKPDDSNISPEDAFKIREQALKALKDADALGRLPTPVADVMEAAKIIVSEDDVFSDGFLDKIRKGFSQAGKTLRRALDKVLGLIDTGARIIYIDRAVPKIKKIFLKLHETAHGILTWQRDIYGAIEDCKKTLDPEISITFEKEANVFASEVLFQLTKFEEEAADHKFGINVPITLSKKYGASIYSTIRRYVCRHNKCCIVLVLEPPVLKQGVGFTAMLRRKIASTSFQIFFGDFECGELFSPDDEIGQMIPLGGKKMSRPKILILTDQNGVEHECVAEAFTNTYQVFILIHEAVALTKTTVLVS